MCFPQLATRRSTAGKLGLYDGPPVLDMVYCYCVSALQAAVLGFKVRLNC